MSSHGLHPLSKFCEHSLPMSLLATRNSTSSAEFPGLLSKSITFGSNWIWHFLILTFLIWETIVRLRTYCNRPVRQATDVAAVLTIRADQPSYYRILCKIWNLFKQIPVYFFSAECYLKSVQRGQLLLWSGAFQWLIITPGRWRTIRGEIFGRVSSSSLFKATHQ